MGSLLWTGVASAQGSLLMVAPPAKVAIKRGATAVAKIPVQLRSGFHVNSNTPSDDYLIPLRLTWTQPALTVKEVKYPAAKMEQYEFSKKPLSVFTGDFEIVTVLEAGKTLAPGMQVMSGRLRYQACNHKECFPPKTVEVKLPVDIQ